MFFVYVLRSIDFPNKTYVGFTKDVFKRVERHNSKSETYSKRYAPWEIISYTSFKTRSAALSYEKYLKTPSGKAFIVKHILQNN